LSVDNFKHGISLKRKTLTIKPLTFSRNKLDFSTTLNKRVHEYFRSAGISKHGNREIVFRALVQPLDVPIAIEGDDPTALIGLPLIAGILILVPPQVWLERRLEGRFQGSLLAFYPHFFDGIYPRGNLSWHHLWFLVFLVVFAIVSLPLFEWLRTPRGRAAMAHLGRLCEGRSGLAWFLLPPMAVRVGTSVLLARLPAVTYDWSNRSLLLPAFLAGFLVAGDRGIQRGIDRHWPAALVLALAVSAALCTWAFPGNVLTRLPPPRSSGAIVLSASYGCAAAAWLVALLGLARRSLVHRSTALARASELAYPFYVLHHGIMMASQTVIVRVVGRRGR
jgi:hypothetical protein